MGATSQIPQGGHGECAPPEFCIRTSSLSLSAKLKEKIKEGKEREIVVGQSEYKSGEEEDKKEKRKISEVEKRIKRNLNADKA